MIRDGDVSDDEMLAVAAQGIDDPDGWSAPEMNQYDQDDNESQP